MTGSDSEEPKEPFPPTSQTVPAVLGVTSTVIGAGAAVATGLASLPYLPLHW